jgi:hypothetical protein
MRDDPIDDLLCACVAFVGTQRRLLDALADPGSPAAAVGTAMTAELDRLAAAVRTSQRRLVPRQRGPHREPGRS